MGEKNTGRSLTKPSDMQIGDLMILDDHFGLPPELRGQSFRVRRISSYEYNYGIYSGFVMESARRERVFMTVDDTDDYVLEFSLKLQQEQIVDLFVADAIQKIVQEKSDCIKLKKNNTGIGIQEWLSASYQRREKPYLMTYFGGQDCRHAEFSRNYPEHGTSHFLHGEDPDKAIELENWGNGEVDVYIVLLIAPKYIKALWVGN